MKKGGNSRLFSFLKTTILVSEDFTQAAEDATKAAAVTIAAIGRATKDSAQHTSQSHVLTNTLLAFAQESEDARSNGSQDVAHSIGGYTALFRDAADD